MSNIREIALLAGVSTATVSRVLNNDITYKMTDATRNRVWKAVTELDYRPKSAALSPKKEKNSAVTIGCVLSVTRDKYKDPYFMSILSGIEERLRQNHLGLSFLRTYLELDNADILRETFCEPMSGVILMDSLQSGLYDYVRARSAHLIGVDTARTDIDNVGYDHYEVAAAATRHLIDKGHRKIGFVGGSGVSGNLRESMRYKGFFATMHAAGLEVNPLWTNDSQWDEALCYQAVTRVLQLPERPTALFCASDLMAMAALCALYSAQVSVPGEMAVIGLSNIEISQFSSPPLTTLEIPTREIGIVAVDMLLERIGGYSLLPRRVTLPATLIPRESA